jgi:hypothetical protein
MLLMLVQSFAADEPPPRVQIAPGTPIAAAEKGLEDLGCSHTQLVNVVPPDDQTELSIFLVDKRTALVLSYGKADKTIRRMSLVIRPLKNEGYRNREISAFSMESQGSYTVTVKAVEDAAVATPAAGTPDAK